jgi:hypothetical protein
MSSARQVPGVENCGQWREGHEQVLRERLA